MALRNAIVVLLLATICSQVEGWYMPYLPGVAPVEFEDSDYVPLKVNKLTSSKRQFPLPYYSLNFCQPDQINNVAENLGEILTGDLIQNSAFELNMKIPVPCRKLCTKPNTVQQLQEFERRIHQGYEVNWIIDNLPAATPKRHQDPNTGRPVTILSAGFPLGYVEGNDVFIYNHYDMLVSFHTSEEFVGKRIVGFQVSPRSIEHNLEDENDLDKLCQDGEPQRINGLDNGAKITYTYSVEWKYDSTRWASRWDVYLSMKNSQIHWFSIVNSLMIVLFLSGMLAMILLKTIAADFARYAELETKEEQQEETGWKLVHGDVFRPPKYPTLLAVSVGTGVQVFFMAVAVLLFALLGFLSPANRGGLVNAIIMIAHFMGVFNGYFSARVYKICKGTNWKLVTACAAFLYPSGAFLIFFILNVELWFEKSTAHVSFPVLCGLVAMILGISVPLVVLGSYFGFKKPPPDNPTRTNQIPRQVPEQPWYMRPIVTILLGGILPFGAVFIELVFILSSLWQHQFYYMFGFLFIVFIILILTCSEICIVMIYFQLCSEDYHWWWRSFLTAGASALYMTLYAIYYFPKLEVEGLAPAMLYFGYTIMMAGCFFLMTGAIGFYSCWFFVRKIYGSVKVE